MLYLALEMPPLNSTPYPLRPQAIFIKYLYPRPFWLAVLRDGMHLSSDFRRKSDNKQQIAILKIYENSYV